MVIEHGTVSGDRDTGCYWGSRGCGTWFAHPLEPYCQEPTEGSDEGQSTSTFGRVFALHRLTWVLSLTSYRVTQPVRSEE